MMKIDIVSIFPEYFGSLNLSLLGKSQDKGLIDLSVHDLRDYSNNIHNSVDDTPYGGGAGMVMSIIPWAKALEDIEPADHQVKPSLIIPTPSGQVFSQNTAEELSQEKHVVFACGRYEGIDERIYDVAKKHYSIYPLSLGDYVLNGGEVAAMAMIETIVRLIPGFMSNPDSLGEESHQNSLLEYPVYTRPEDYENFRVPTILLSGHHKKIQLWRFEQQLERTYQRRPDLFKMIDISLLSKEEKKIYDHFVASKR